jgi:hypothetical protein
MAGWEHFLAEIFKGALESLTLATLLALYSLGGTWFRTLLGAMARLPEGDQL